MGTRGREKKQKRKKERGKGETDFPVLPLSLNQRFIYSESPIRGIVTEKKGKRENKEKKGGRISYKKNRCPCSLKSVAGREAKEKKRKRGVGKSRNGNKPVSISSERGFFCKRRERKKKEKKGTVRLKTPPAHLKCNFLHSYREKGKSPRRGEGKKKKKEEKRGMGGGLRASAIHLCLPSFAKGGPA